MSREELSTAWDTITPKLFGYLVNVLRDRAVAEDVFQTTWVKAIEGLATFRPRGAGLSAWLFAIARNECQQYWRRANREVPFDVQEHDVVTEQGSDSTILAEQILAKLPEDDRELLRLRYIADLSMNEIAKILKTNSVAVRVRVHRALKRAASHHAR